MHKNDVKTPDEALAYLTSCTLATVEWMCGNKSRPVGEFNRQVEMARSSLDWCRQFGVQHSESRIQDVERAGGLDNWVAQQIAQNSVHKKT